MKAADWPGVHHVRQAVEWGKRKYAGSWAEDLWHRLDTVDFMNQAMLLAATLLLCAFPFILIASALAGRSVVSALTVRLGLSQQAAADFGHLLTSSSATSAAVTGLAWVFFILGGIAAATAIQRLYQLIFQLKAQRGRDRLCAAGWGALVVGWLALGTTAGHKLSASAPVLWWIVNIPVLIGFWWFTMWLLLAGRVHWTQLAPCAVATGTFWMGMLAVFHVIFSGMVVSYDQKYGPIGAVFAVMSLFIAIGVVIILGAAVGLMWHDRGMSFRAAVTRLRRAS